MTSLRRRGGRCCHFPVATRLFVLFPLPLPPYPMRCSLIRRLHRFLWFSLVLLLLLFSPLLGLKGGDSAQAARFWTNSRGNLGNEVLYYIVVDRFFDGDPRNNVPLEAFPIDPGQDPSLDPRTQAYNQANRSILPHTYDRTHRYMKLYWGGDLAGVLQKLDYLQDLGVTKIILSEIQDSANGILYQPGSSSYLYQKVKTEEEPVNPFYNQVDAGFNSGWTKDWFEVDEHFRDVQAGATPDDRLRLFRQLLDAANDRDIGIILDLNLNHSSPYRSQLGYGDFDPNQSERWLIDNGAIYRQGERVADYVTFGSPAPPIGAVQDTDPAGAASAQSQDASAPCATVAAVAAVSSPRAQLNPQGWFHDPVPLDYNRPTPTMLEQAPIGGLPDLNQENPQVETYLLDALRFWLQVNPDGAPIAGFYLPNIPQVNVAFWQKLEQAIAAVNPEAILIAAYGDGGYRKGDSIDWYEKTQHYSLVNYSLSIALRRFFGQDRGWDGRTAVLRETLLGKAGRYYNYGPLERALHWLLNPSESLEIPRHALDVVAEADAKGWVNFVDSPEQPRLMSYYKDMTYQAYASALKFIFASEGVPLVLYGAETGLAVPHHPSHSGPFGIGGDPFNQQMMIWPEDGGWNDRLYQLTRNLIHLRRDYPLLRYGDTRFLFPDGSQADQDLFMLREFQDCEYLDQDCPDPSQILYAYSTEGGDFLVSFDEHQVRSVRDVEAEMTYPVVKGLVPIKLQPEEAKVLVLQPQR